MASTESQVVVLRPRARILRTLGEELISSETVAIIELVKNSYDADATHVLVRFIGRKKDKVNSIEIMDNGHGMSFNTVCSAWMEPATNTKKKKARSEDLKRRMLGDKGIGRFAAARLAKELELITRRESSRQETYAIFDWSQFEDEKKFLDEIEIVAEEREPQDIYPEGSIKALWGKDEEIRDKDLTHGTILRMNGLKQTWRKQNLEELQRGLSRLIPPFKKQSNFTIHLELPGQFSDFSQEIAPPVIIKYPHYSVKGKIGSHGRYSLDIKVHQSGEKQEIKGAFKRETDSERLLMIDQIDLKQMKDVSGNSTFMLPQCGPLEVELKIWDRDELGNVEQMTGLSITNVRRDLDDIAGINIYRDDFRVLPYGELKNDWLRLDIRRVQKPTYRLSNNQIVGYIKITADNNPRLRDQSNREGLDENQALSDLRMILLNILTQIEAIRYKQRPRRKKKTPTPLTSLFTSFDLKTLRDQIIKEYPKDIKTINILDETEKAIDTQLDEIQTVLSRYHRLATLGQLIDVVLHDGRQPVAAIVNEALHGLEDIEELQKEYENLLFIHNRFKLIERQGNVLSTIFKRIEPFGGRRRGRPSQLYLEKIISDSFAIFDKKIKILGIKVALPKTQTLVRIDEAEMQEVIVNLLQNSLYWLQHVDKKKREIALSVNRIAADNLQIVFADSGPGVSKKIRDVIFDPYFSTKPDGVGLGLSIAGEIISDFYGGKLDLMDSGKLPGAVFRITLRKRI